MNKGRKVNISVITGILFFSFIIPVVLPSPSVFAQDELNELKIGSIEGIDSASPFVGIYDISHFYYGLVYDYLICPDEDMNPSPNLANSWWYLDGPTAYSLGQDFSTFIFNNPADWPLGSIWEFNITENVYWNDG